MVSQLKQELQSLQVITNYPGGILIIESPHIAHSHWCVCSSLPVVYIQVMLSQADAQSVHRHYEETLSGVRDKATYASRQLSMAAMAADQSIRYIDHLFYQGDPLSPDNAGRPRHSVPGLLFFLWRPSFIVSQPVRMCKRWGTSPLNTPNCTIHNRTRLAFFGVQL